MNISHDLDSSHFFSCELHFHVSYLNASKLNLTLQNYL